jgi:hypothetical protein
MQRAQLSWSSQQCLPTHSELLHMVFCLLFTTTHARMLQHPHTFLYATHCIGLASGYQRTVRNGCGHSLTHTLTPLTLCCAGVTPRTSAGS